MKKRSTLTYLVKKVQFPQEMPDHPVVRCNEMERPVVENINQTPSKKSIQRILDFARAYDVVLTKATGHVELILN